MKVLAIPMIVLALVAVLGLGFFLGRSGKIVHETDEIWTCPMHPEIQLPAPGPCPKCSMDLVLLKQDKDLGPRQLRISEAAKKLAEIITVAVERKIVAAEVRMVGMVEYDETRVRTISAWVPGRLDRLFVDFTGTRVRQGDHLVSLYSPEVLTAQQELLEARRQVTSANVERSEFLRESDKRALASARDKLRLWGLTKEQVKEIETRGTAEDHVIITTPTAGIVIHKALNQGDYVKEGTPIYKIADLDHLWLQLDAYETDIPWIRYGQDVVITTEAHPGEEFSGWITFLSPELDRKTRTLKVRVNVDNRDRKLKPGMFVRAVVTANLAAGGRVVAPKLAGKWICPMHTEVVEEKAGPCRVCGMKLMQAEELGYVIAKSEAELPIVVPVTAVLWTGKRSLVYVEVPGQDKPTYEGREVVLGPRAKDYYLIEQGLEEGEMVVVHGNFKIDSALQILAKPSMMSNKATRSATSRPTTQKAYDKQKLAKLRPALEPLYVAYLAIQEALAKDEFDKAKTGHVKLADALTGVDMKLFGPVAHTKWMAYSDALKFAIVAAHAATDLEGLRVAFGLSSQTILALVATFGHAGEATRFELFCPMAFANKGAYWLQSDAKTRNPYFGSAMLTCGTVKRSFPAAQER